MFKVRRSLGVLRLPASLRYLSTLRNARSPLRIEGSCSRCGCSRCVVAASSGATLGARRRPVSPARRGPTEVPQDPRQRQRGLGAAPDKTARA
eukprot:193212-Alexandrium_andersonii.AAC.1